MIGDNGRVAVKLLPYDLDYFKGMDKAFSWPATVKLDQDDKPIVPVAGLTNSTDFFIS
jgi:hypothetical protein